MSKFIAVKPSTQVSTLDTPLQPRVNELKRQALVFDQIAITNVVALHEGLEKIIVDTKTAETDWLYQNNILVDSDKLLLEKGGDEETEPLEQQMNYEKWKMFELLMKGGSNLSKSEYALLLARMNRTFDIQVRIHSVKLRSYYQFDAYPLLINELQNISSGDTNKSDVLEIVLNQFPVPSADTPWEQILEFRSDPESRSKFMRLRVWISDVARMALPKNEVEEKLESLIHEYHAHMKTHRMKTFLDALKTTVIAEVGFVTGGWLTGLGAVPGLVGMVSTPFYTIKQRQVALMSEELKAPGREIAYIEAARQSFK